MRTLRGNGTRFPPRTLYHLVDHVPSLQLTPQLVDSSISPQLAMTFVPAYSPDWDSCSRRTRGRPTHHSTATNSPPSLEEDVPRAPSSSCGPAPRHEFHSHTTTVLPGHNTPHRGKGRARHIADVHGAVGVVDRRHRKVLGIRRARSVFGDVRDVDLRSGNPKQALRVQPGQRRNRVPGIGQEGPGDLAFGL